MFDNLCSDGLEEIEIVLIKPVDIVEDISNEDVVLLINV